MSFRHQYDVCGLISEAEALGYSQESMGESERLHGAVGSKLHVQFLRGARWEYGPWIDHQRAIIQSYFSPPAYRNQTVWAPEAGQLWPHLSFEITLDFKEAGSFRIPFRTAKQLLRQEHGSAGAADLKLRFDAGSSLCYNMQLMPLTAKEGTLATLQVDLLQFMLTPSRTGAVLLEADIAELRATMRYPTKWNELYAWDFDLACQPARVWLLRDHLDVFTELTADWSTHMEELEARQTRGEGRRLCYFAPADYTYRLSLGEVEVLCNVNENNVVDVCNSVEHNTHLVLKGPGGWGVSQPS